MPGSENNNKPGVKLAVTADINGKPCPLTILESVVKQTGVYGKSRKGRLSVFWGDQVCVCVCLFFVCILSLVIFGCIGDVVSLEMYSFLKAGVPWVSFDVLICFRTMFIIGAMRPPVNRSCLVRVVGRVCFTKVFTWPNERRVANLYRKILGWDAFF